MTKTYPDSVIVDENDNEVGHMQLFDALESDRIMRVARVFVFNDKEEMLLQQRGKQVLAPLLWNEAAAGRVDVGDDYLSTAVTELAEETGIKAQPEDLEEVDYGYQDETNGSVRARHFYKTYRYIFNGNVSVVDPGEVEAFRWISIPALQEEFEETPHCFTGGFIDAASHYLKK